MHPLQRGATKAVTPSSNGRADPLVALRAAEHLVEQVERDRDAAREEGRRILGVDHIHAVEPLSDVMRDVGVRQLVAVSILSGIWASPLAIVAMLGPRLAGEAGGGAPLVLGLLVAWAAGLTYASVIAPALPRSTPAGTGGRAVLVGAAGALTGLTLVIASAGPLLGGFASAGLAAGVGMGLSRALAVDSYPASARMQIQLMVRVGWFAGALAVAVLVAALEAFTSLTARSNLAVIGIVDILAVAATIGLKDPGPGRRDRTLLHSIAGDTAVDGPTLSWRASVRRVFVVPSFRTTINAHLALGLGIVATHVYLIRVMGLRWGLGAWGRGTIYASACLAAIAALALSGRRLAMAFREQPSRVADPTVTAFVAAGAALALAGIWPSSGGATFVLATFGLSAVAALGLDSMMIATVRPELRSTAHALSLSLTGAGAAAGALLLHLIDLRSGPGPTLVAAGLAMIAATPRLRQGVGMVNADLDAVITAEVEVAELATLVARGSRLPLLACSHIDFSYGSVQVLFDVSFTVDDGEMVALLGTNGAGKSTLLRVISGLGLPSAGTVRITGEDITFADTASRVARGITQIPGGRAVFGPMTVTENLRTFAYSLGRDRAAAKRGIDTAFETFPKLAERRDQLAQTLSGGERQMLALGKALIIKPRLLLIDELSLGLAPVVVGELLEMVRMINREGTAVVLVEQSVNVALSLADHAYYMEKGEMRFDGPAVELLARPDLLRSVYLKGAAEGLAG